MKNAKLTAAILAAAVYGTLAFKAGIKCVAWSDANLRQLLEQNPDNCLPLLKAWNQAWHDANIAA